MLALTQKFDIYVAIDWSGACAPEKSRSLALAYCQKGKSAPEIMDYPLKRSDVGDWIEGRLASNERCLIGIDCNFGFGSGTFFADENLDYHTLWKAIDDSCAKLPDYFAQAFWEHEVYGRPFWKKGTKPLDFDSYRRRLTETVCSESGYGNPENPLKLIGPKQVGKGGLSGMRMLYTLKKKHGNRICIWPFEDNYNEAQIVIAEIYPRIFLKACGMINTKIKDIMTLNKALSFFCSNKIKLRAEISDHISDAVVSSAALRHMAEEKNELGRNILRPYSFPRQVIQIEGWILGV